MNKKKSQKKMFDKEIIIPKRKRNMRFKIKSNKYT